MLSSALGIRMLIWTGKMIPTPPPRALLEAIIDVEVTNDVRNADGFKITLALTKSTLDYNLVLAGALDPMTKVTIAVVMGVMPEVLINGIVTRHEIHPSNEPGASRLVVYGKDLRLLLDLEERNDKFEAQPDFIIFSRLIASYAHHGLLPDPRATNDFPLPIERTPHQAETDLAFIERMARRNGFLFYIEPVTVGLSHAYFGPPIRASLPQTALTINIGGHDNVKSLSFELDEMAPTGVSGTFIEPFTKMSLPIPTLPSLRIPPLALFPTSPQRTKQLRNAAQRNPAQAALAGLAETMNAEDSVRVRGEADGAKLGSVLRTGKLVGLRGVGYSFGGNYYVEKVTHKLSSGTYTQQFELTREGKGAIAPVVRP